jgi:hypothetical protein
MAGKFVVFPEVFAQRRDLRRREVAGSFGQ